MTSHRPDGSSIHCEIEQGELMSSPVVIVVGAGPGVSGSVARKFGREGYDTVLVCLDPAVLDDLAATLRVDGIETVVHVVDITDTKAFKAALTSIGETAGRIDVLHFNPSAFRQKSPLELSRELQWTL